MGQHSSRHGGGAKNVKAGLALIASDGRKAKASPYSHPAALQIRSSVHDNIIGRTQTPETTLHGTSQTLSNPSTEIHTMIEEVPVEIFHEIAKYLSPASVRSLSYTCRSLSETFGASAAEMMGETPERRLEHHWKYADRWSRSSGTETEYAYSYTEDAEYDTEDTESDTEDADLDTGPNEWVELLVMLLRDNMWPGKAVCSACIRVHEKSAFSQTSLDQPPTKSKCLATGGWVKICPHTRTNFLELKGTCNSPELYKRLLKKEPTRFPKDDQDEGEDGVAGAWKARLDPEQMEEAETQRAQRKEAKEIFIARVAAEHERVWTTERVKTCNKCVIPVTITSWGKSRVCFPLAVMSQRDFEWFCSPSAEDLTNHMKSLEAAVCPHLKLNSHDVMKTYRRKCKRFGGRRCHCPSCSAPYDECALCHARFWFDVGDFSDLKHVIHLVVERSFDPSVGVADGAWINQMIPKTGKSSERGSWWFDRLKFVDSSGYRITKTTSRTRNTLREHFISLASALASAPLAVIGNAASA